MSSAVASGSGPSKKLNPTESKLNKTGLAAPNKTISQKDLLEQCGLASTQTTTEAINSLLRKNLMQVLKNGQGEYVFKFIGKEEAKAMGQMDGEEKLVFDQIREAGNLGIWTKTITTRTGLPRTTITKVLKSLEGKKTVKTVKSVKAPTRKIYMLAGIVPSVELTGGPWFTDNELDVEFVNLLKKCAHKFLQTKSTPDQKTRQIFPTASTQYLPTVADVREYIAGLNVAAVELLDEHVESLLELMVFDGTVEKILVFHQTAGDGPHPNGNGRSSASSSRKRKSHPVGTDSDSDAPRRRRGRPSAKSKEAKQKLAKLSRQRDDSESESDPSSESDFDSDEDAETRRQRKADKGEDADDGEGKKSSRRRKKRVQRRKIDSEDEAEPSSESGEDEDRNPGARANGRQQSALDGSTDYVYRLIKPFAPVVGWTDMPCGRCPAEAFCTEPTREPGAHHSGGPKVGMELEGGMQGVGMMGGAGAAIGVSTARWGEVKGAVGFGVAPVNPRDCHYFRDWLAF